MKTFRQLALTLLLSGYVLCSVSGQGTLSRHPYPQMPTQQSVVLAWRTVGGTIPIVRFGTTTGVLDQTVLPTQIQVRVGPDVQGPPGLPRLHSAPVDTYQYEASIFNLAAGTRYYYGVYDNEQLLAGGDENHFFTTLPSAESTEPLRLWVVGDSGNGSGAQIAGFNAMRGFVAAEGRAVDAYIHLGDMAYNVGLDREFSSYFFEIYRDLLRNTTCWPTMGNHEGSSSSGVTQKGPYYDSYVLPTRGESGGLESGTEAYYSFDIGRVHFVCLNSHDLDRSSTGDMALWLKADLEMADADWLIAFWHHPPYTKGTHDSDREIQLIEMRSSIMPILESAGVDLVMGGHSHIYERSMLIDGAYETPTVAEGVILDDGDGDPAGDGAYLKSGALNPNEGTVALVAGHGRSAISIFGSSPVMRSTIAQVGSVLIDIDGDTLTGQMINSNGEVADTFQMKKQGIVEQQIVDFPWQPIGPSYQLERLRPGSTSVSISANPRAPDAVIYYTTDGSLPTIDSPVYTGSIEVGATTRVRAFSAWRGGSRTSLVSESELIQPWVSYQQLVGDGSDDGFEELDGTVALGALQLPLGEAGVVGLRFENVQIPEGAYIYRAKVQFAKSEVNYSASLGNIWGELSPNSPPFAEEIGNFTARPRTTNTVSWQLFGWSITRLRDFQSETSEMRAILAEQLSQEGWQSGDPLSYFFELSGFRLAEAYESGSARAAALIVTYIDPDGLAERLTQHPPKIALGDNGISYEIKFRWLVEEAALALGLGFQVETSPDLREWMPINPVAVGSGAADPAGFQELTAFVDAPRLIRDGAGYFRVKIIQMDENP